MSGSRRRTDAYAEWALPRDHPALQMLLEEIQNLKDKLQSAKIATSMYYRHAQLLAEHVDVKTAYEIHKKVWGE